MTRPIAIGTVLEVTDYHRTTSSFVAVGYNETNYLMLSKKDDASVSMTIHPDHAVRLAARGVDSGIKVLDCISLNNITVKTTEAIVAGLTPLQQVFAKAAKQSKKERALEIKADHPTASRKELIQMFVEQLGMTPAGASTYASMKA